MRIPFLPSRLAAASLMAAALVWGWSACSSTPLAHLPGHSGPPQVIALHVEAPRPLASLLEQGLDLGQVNRLANGKPLPPAELARLVAETPRQARELLQTEGYFDADVQVQAGEGVPAPVHVTVQPGPRTIVRDVRLTVRGPLQAATMRQDPAAREAQKALRSNWLLPPGSPFRQQDWDKAKGGALTDLRSQGYVQAQWAQTEAVIDAATHEADLVVTLDSGPLYRTGPLVIQGLKRQDERTVRNIAGITPGSPATEALLLDFQDRLQKSDLFDRATVTLQPDPAHPESTPILVQLSERKLQDARFVVGVAADVGAHGSVEHVHRRPFGQAWIARNTVDLAQLAQRWDGEISTQPLPDQYHNLVAAGLARETTSTDVVATSHVRVGRQQETNRISRLYFAEVQHSITHSALGRQAASSIALHDHGIWRQVDDPLQPTRGRVWTGQVGAGLARSDPGGNGPFSRVYGKLNVYQPFADHWHASGRVELGQVFGRTSLLIPEELMFRAGGEGWVRGYGYRSLSPTVNGVQVSGRVLMTASAEVARPITPKLPDLWGALFVDAGDAAMHWNELKPAVGYGVGARYRSPIGPLKVDLAYGQRVHRVRLHLSVGVDF
jgi:translocation and assembly module TamA